MGSEYSQKTNCALMFLYCWAVDSLAGVSLSWRDTAHVCFAARGRSLQCFSSTRFFSDYLVSVKNMHNSFLLQSDLKI